jgi:ABC-2 type transport system permease protein
MTVRTKSASSANRISTLLSRDLRLSPRSPIVLLAVVMPILITLVVRTVFGGLLEAPPSLTIVAPTESAVTQAAEEVDGVDISFWDTPSAAVDAVSTGESSAALILPDNIDAELQTGDPIEVRYIVAGDTLAVDRAVLAATVTDILQTASGQDPVVTVNVEIVGDEDFIPLADRMLPLLVIYAIMIAGLFVPAASLMDERTKGTLDAVLQTPATMGEVLASKGLFAGALAMALGMVTLAINTAFAGQFVGLTLALLAGTVMLVLLGLLLGMWTKDMTALYTWIKAGGILIVLPALVIMFPGIPQWIGQITPTYYFLAPVFDLSVGGSTLADVWPDLAIATLISLALIPIVLWSAGLLTDQRRRG